MAELTRRQCEQVLARAGLGRIGCFSPSRDEVYVVPVAFTFHPGALYLELVPGQKLDYLEEHPQGVCLEVEQVEAGQTWSTVVVTGEFERVQPEGPPAAGRRGPLRTTFEIGLSPYSPESLVLCKLTIGKMSGRRDSWSWQADLPSIVRKRRAPSKPPAG